MEILPIKLLTTEDVMIFGTSSVNLGKLARLDFPVAKGFIATAPDLKLKTLLEHFDFGSKEIFEQSLTLIAKEIKSIPIPEMLTKECGKYSNFFINEESVRGVKSLWEKLLEAWLYQIKSRIWRGGFSVGMTQGLEPQTVIFAKKVESFGTVYFDLFAGDSVVKTGYGKLHPKDIKILDETAKAANKKLFMPFEYQWIVDGGVKLVGIKPYINPSFIEDKVGLLTKKELPTNGVHSIDQKSAVKVFIDLSSGLVESKQIDGVFIASEKVYDLNKPRESFDDLVVKVMDIATTYPLSPVLFKLADKSEGLPAGRQGMGKVRGSLRLLHQESLFTPLIQILDFIRHKKGLTNVHIVIPFVRSTNEFLSIKRELAVKKLMRKNSLKIWLEIAVPENIINLENYLLAGVDGVVLNLDELSAYINGFDYLEEELSLYKNEIDGLLKFLVDGLKLLHKSKVLILVTGNIVLYPKVLEFLVEKGIFGIVIQRYEFFGISNLLKDTERRALLKKVV